MPIDINSAQMILVADNVAGERSDSDWLEDFMLYPRKLKGKLVRPPWCRRWQTIL